MAVNLTSHRSLKGWGWKSATRSSSHSQIYCQRLQSYTQRSGVARHRRVVFFASQAPSHHHQLTSTPPINLPPPNNGTTPQPPPTSTSTHSLWSPIFRRAECRIGPERPVAPTHTNGLFPTATLSRATLPTATTTTTNNAPQPARHRPRLKPQHLPPPSPRAPLGRRSPPQPR